MVNLELYALSVLCKDHDAEAYEESKELYLEAMRYREIARQAQVGAEALIERFAAEAWAEAGLNKICTWSEMCEFWNDHK